MFALFSSARPFFPILLSLKQSSDISATSLPALALSDFSTFISSLLSIPALWDWLKIFLIGSVLEYLRRAVIRLYQITYNWFFVTAAFEDIDSSYGAIGVASVVCRNHKILIVNIWSCAILKYPTFGKTMLIVHNLKELRLALSRRIALVEDIDAAFTNSLSRDLPQESELNPSLIQEQGTNRSHVTLSGLLNALDGVAAQEGRLLYATTNKYEALDPALIRPGRMDLHIEFKAASKYQAQELYRCFFLPDADSPTKTDLPSNNS
ncbi:hypothetical protein NP233_g6980 [Leucocoprinus birnbaumii]|uniref:ATPase AAA-type core domain-containing protein n=1 Tax=Leucocoprinus birnbaumii TaxID=56174 RepID=A0AAD5VVM6_9AGAR|nr:hypothetical protein NP233_g6980 [Leucocoprinus birnbaumii]